MEDGRGGRQNRLLPFIRPFSIFEGGEEKEAGGTASRTDSVQRHADLPFQHESPPPSSALPLSSNLQLRVSCALFYLTSLERDKGKPSHCIFSG